MARVRCCRPCGPGSTPGVGTRGDKAARLTSGEPQVFVKRREFSLVSFYTRQGAAKRSILHISRGCTGDRGQWT